MPNSEDIETLLASIYQGEFGDSPQIAKRLAKVVFHPVLTWSALRYVAQFPILDIAITDSEKSKAGGCSIRDAPGESADSSCPTSNFRHHFICIGKVRQSKISERERTKHEPLATRSERLNQLRSAVSLHKCLEVEDGMRTT
jgi:hypothetical protein